MMKINPLLLLIILAAPPAQVLAGTDPMEGMDHSKMSHGGTASGPHAAVGPAPTAHQHGHTGNHPSATQAPEEARDPNAYSDGYGFGENIAYSHKEEHHLGALLVDRLEGLGNGKQSLMTYDWQAWYGKTYDRAVVRAEGNLEEGQFADARNEVLWGHALTPYWDTQLGVRYDTGLGPDRSWFAFGFQGLAPYWVYIEATAYVGEQGRFAFRFESEYDLLITQRLILQPRIEANIYSQHDPGRGVSDGLSSFESGLRLRYEIRREFAPYIGVEWSTSHDANSLADTSTDNTRWVAGVRFWF
ncbi:MAG: copper resistance protein B [Methylovulum miyakonense]|uniref:copper resistance protein B n=1 Tax=Methylovulum miyakonense TaxID=645578 RepID=UPI003BB688A6